MRHYIYFPPFPSISSQFPSLSLMYHILNDHPEQTLIERLFQIRNISDSLEDFLNPSFQRYRTPRQLFDDANLAAWRVMQAIKNQEKIMIFGDYDADGIMSSFVLYTFFRDHIGYHNISLRLPHRVRDGYGIKIHHLDEIKTTGATLVITVDNWITAVEEAKHAKSIGIDLIITDHHKPLAVTPDAFACINPQCTPEHTFKEICWAVVASKFCLAIADQSWRTKERKYQRVMAMIPYLTIATVADCMPLIGENRLIVKTGLDLMSNHKNTLHPPLRAFLNHLNLDKVDTFQIWFVIAPRLNATWRVWHALDWLKALLTKDPEKQKYFLDHMDTLNTERKKIQEWMIQETEATLDHDQPLIRAASEQFHEWIVGIVAWRVTEKYNKPSLIMSVNAEEWVAMWSLRWPERFNIVEMLKTADAHLLRYGGHAQAWWVTLTLENLDNAIACFMEYCLTHPAPDETKTTICVDTAIYEHEMVRSSLKDIPTFGPYGEANPEPLFVLENTVITNVSTVWKNGSWHLKLQWKKDETPFTSMQRGKGDTAWSIIKDTPVHLIWRVKEDTFNGGWYLDMKHIIVNS